MERQLKKAYRLSAINQLSPGMRRLRIATMVFGAYGVIINSTLDIDGELPSWARKALKISEWNDVERLESELIRPLPADSFLVKEFQIDKQKLQVCLTKLAAAVAESERGDQTESNQLLPNISLTSGDSVAFPFRMRTHHLFKGEEAEMTFDVSCTPAKSGKVWRRSVTAKVVVHASPFAVPAGAVLGAISGFLIRLGILGIPAAPAGAGATNGASATVMVEFGWLGLVASILLGLLCALVTRRKPEVVRQSIIVDDFWGGFIIGAFVGLFTESFVGRLAAIIK